MANREKKPEILPMHIILLIPAAIIVVGLVFKLFALAVGAIFPEGLFHRPEETTPSETTVATDPPGPTLIATATLGAQGDMLMHKPIFNTGAVCNLGDGSYDFSSIFRYMGDYSGELNYMVANLETTFGGDDYPYQGNPSFNCPDSLLDALKAAGYDMLLTANNHSNDTLMHGIERTLKRTREEGLATLGTRLDGEERYTVVDINGIQVGMVCYTYAAEIRNGKPSLNFNTPVSDPERINYFTTTDLDSFYAEAEDVIADMRSAGAEATVFYIHWGVEYEIMQNSAQDSMAQELCDMGVDVIIGGHPHVVQPVELLTGTTDANHKTVCIYSLGNAVSNQRIAEMNMKTGHTEDGVLFTVSFEKYSDGTVCIGGADVLPTWVNLHSANGGKEYNILPLDAATLDQWQTLYNLTDAQYTAAKDSYARTMDIVGEGMQQVKDWLAEEN
ncbi:MAG: CapA family protein [Oscillospiraceae bacterium]|nr:CapA family protein [Oscillospiraceae bacterium]